MASDNKIIELIKQGDIAAFNTLFKSVYLQLYIHCRKFIPDPEDAKDILQNVFLRFWEKRENIDIHTSLNAYLYRAIQNDGFLFLSDFINQLKNTERMPQLPSFYRNSLFD